MSTLQMILTVAALILALVGGRLLWRVIAGELSDTSPEDEFR